MDCEPAEWRERRRALMGALASFHNDLKPAVKNASNPTLRNKYADYDSCVRAVEGPLAKHGLVFVQVPTCNPREGTVTVQSILFHIESGAEMVSDLTLPIMEPNRGTNEVQQAGISITYALRYALKTMLRLPQEDQDGYDAREKGRANGNGAPKPDPLKALKGEIMTLAKAKGLDLKDLGHIAIATEMTELGDLDSKQLVRLRDLIEGDGHVKIMKDKE